MTSPENAGLASRIQTLEERLMFLQRTVDHLNEVLLQHEQRLGEMARELATVGTALERLADAAADSPLPHEKPPHY